MKIEYITDVRGCAVNKFIVSVNGDNREVKHEAVKHTASRVDEWSLSIGGITVYKGFSVSASNKSLSEIVLAVEIAKVVIESVGDRVWEGE